jgi:hypothetical protein
MLEFHEDAASFVGEAPHVARMPEPSAMRWEDGPAFGGEQLYGARHTSECTRHINVRYYWVKDRIDSGDIQIVYLPTEDMVADIFTKPVQGQKFFNLRAMLLNWRF